MYPLHLFLHYFKRSLSYLLYIDHHHPCFPTRRLRQWFLQLWRQVSCPVYPLQPFLEVHHVFFFPAASASQANATAPNRREWSFDVNVITNELILIFECLNWWTLVEYITEFPFRVKTFEWKVFIGDWNTDVWRAHDSIVYVAYVNLGESNRSHNCLKEVAQLPQRSFWDIYHISFCLAFAGAYRRMYTMASRVLRDHQFTASSLRGTATRVAGRLWQNVSIIVTAANYYRICQDPFFSFDYYLGYSGSDTSLFLVMAFRAFKAHLPTSMSDFLLDVQTFKYSPPMLLTYQTCDWNLN